MTGSLTATREAEIATRLGTEMTGALVRHVRELVVNEGHNVTDVSRLTGLSRTQVHNIVVGRCYVDAGGPIRAPKPRVRGERRHCSRCRSHFDVGGFAIVRDSRTGICLKCVKDEDFDVPNKSWERRKRQSQQRVALRAEIDKLAALPWESVLDENDRAELDRTRAEIKRAMIVCGAPWSGPRMGRGRL